MVAAMEFVVVEFTNNANETLNRGVIIDEQASGQTYTTLMVEEGNHEFKLANPQDYTPAVHDVLVQHTTSTHPMRIHFTQNGG